MQLNPVTVVSDIFSQNQPISSDIETTSRKEHKLIKKIKAFRSISNSDENEINSDAEIKQIHQTLMRKKLNKSAVNSVDSLFHSLQMADNQNSISKTNTIPDPIETMDTENKESLVSNEECSGDSETERMALMGLPVAFGQNQRKKSQELNTRKRT